MIYVCVCVIFTLVNGKDLWNSVLIKMKRFVQWASIDFPLSIGLDSNIAHLKIRIAQK